MKWVTRERPVIDRIACPWLIARFIDKQPEFLFVPSDQVRRVATETGARSPMTYLGWSLLLVKAAAKRDCKYGGDEYRRYSAQKFLY